MLGIVLLTALLLFQTPLADPGGQAPGFTLKTLTGRRVRLSDYRGKVVLINFWATWCAPCLAEMPELAKLQMDYEGKGLQVIGVTYGRERVGRITKITRKLKVRYPVLIGTSGLAARYGVGEVLPVTIVVDRKSVIRYRFLGVLDPDELDKVKELVR
jgi:peroxiredoxin